MMTMRQLFPLLLLTLLGPGCTAHAGYASSTKASLTTLPSSPTPGQGQAHAPGQAHAAAEPPTTALLPQLGPDSSKRAAAAKAKDQPNAASPPEPASAHDARDIVTETPIDAPPFSEPLENGLFNPMPGGFVGGYRADTGLDIAGFHMPVYAIASGTLEYSEPGHTRWASDDRAIRIRLDQPIDVVQQLPDGRGQRTTRITHVWYAHLSQLRFLQRSGSRHPRRVKGGELLGISGMANGSPHLHLGMLLDNVVDQRWGSYLLDDECRRVLGGWRRGQRLPRLLPKARG